MMDDDLEQEAVTLVKRTIIMVLKFFTVLLVVGLMLEYAYWHHI